MFNRTAVALAASMLIALLFPLLAYADSGSADLSADIMSGLAPLTVTFSGNTTDGCSNGSYTITYGDGASDSIPIASSTCDISYTVTHTYTSVGAYTATIKAGGDVLGTQNITVSGINTSLIGYRIINNFALSYTPSRSNGAQTTFTIQSLSDAMCDGVSYTIDYGDGASQPLAPSCDDAHAIDIETTSHTYASAASFTVSLRRNGQAIETLPINLGAAVQTSLSAATTTGTGPLSVSFNASAALSDGDSNGNITLFFGDAGTDASFGLPAGGAGTLQHTYTIPGSYVVKMQKGNIVLKTMTIIVRTTGDQNENDAGTIPCANLTMTLQRGDTDATTGGQVSQLQQFLTDYFGLDGSLIVGTYGPLTESYVKQFQSANGISPVGFVGPQTRAAIAALCAGPHQVYPFSAAPTSGAAPLAVDFAYADPNQHMTYNVNFGDNTTAQMVYTIGTDCSGSSGCAPRYDAPHMYTTTGTYTATVTSLIDPCNGDPNCTTPAQVYQLATTSVTVSGSTAGNGNCVVLSHNLFLDVSDDTVNGDVTRLQNFLIAGGFMQGSATGFFGPMTEGAVEAFQSANGIVSSGTPDTTGYGYVGPKTRSVMSSGCTTPASVTAFSAAPSSGSAPLSVTFAANNLQSGVAYTIDTGDGSVMPVSASAESCQSGSPCTISAAHQYQTPGTFTAKLLKPASAVTCTDVNYDPNDPLSFLNLGTSPNCTNASSSAVVASVSVTVSGCGVLGGGTSMTPGQTITSCNARYGLTFQSDGNVVLYDNSSHAALWSTGTAGKTAVLFGMQSDGNLVLYSQSPYVNANALWASGSVPPTGSSFSGGGTFGTLAKLAVQDDGNLVVYRLSDNKIFWTSGTAR